MLTAGYLGMFLSAFLASTIIPLSSDLVLIGLLQTDSNPLYLFLLATMGNSLGGMTSFWFGRLGRWDWLLRYFGVRPEKVLKWGSWTQRYSPLLAFFSWIPVLGDVFCIALGYFRSNWKISFFSMTIGKALRYAIIIYLAIGLEF